MLPARRHQAVNGVPSCADGQFQNGLLRETWGFTGLIVSDCEAIRNESPSGHNFTGSVVEAVALSIKAGTDTDCGPEEYRDYIKAALDEGLLSESDLDKAVSRILKASFRLGELEGNGTVPAQRLGVEVVDAADHRTLALEAAEQAITLLRNQAGLLPLSKAQTVAFIGPHANSSQALLSTYQGENLLVNNHTALLAAQAMGLQVTYERGQGPSINDPNTSRIPAAVAAAKAAEVAVVFVGISSLGKANEGEGMDREGLLLPGSQEQLLQAVLQAQPKTVVVIVGGGSLSVAAARYCKTCAVLYAYYPGELGGDAMVNTLVGLNNPSGRLPYTLYPANMTVQRKINEYDLRSHDGLTYQWYTGRLSGPALWSFGEGGSYTTFNYTWSSPPPTAIATSQLYEELTYSVRVDNTGNRDGATTVLAFATGGDGQATPLQKLVGFDRVWLRAGDSATVTITTPAHMMAIVHENGRRLMRARSDVTIVVGDAASSLTIAGPDIVVEE